MAQTTAGGAPLSDGFDFPVGPRGKNVDVFKTHKIDTTLVDPGYFKSFNTWHTGEDWNGRGGGDTDLGDPIYAISHGRVVEFGNYPPSWGNIVLLQHVLPDGTQVWSQYAHLEKIMVEQVGQTVQRGQQIGTMGKGAKTDKYPRGRYIAHLHFEIRREKLPIDNWFPMVRDRQAVLANYHNPTTFINGHRPGSFAQPTQTIEAVQLVIDTRHQDSKTGLFRRSQSDWRSGTGGFQNDTLWTPASTQQESHWAEWRPILPDNGPWELWAFIPKQQATTTYARYTINHAQGQTVIPVNQGGNRNQWVILGTFRFDPRGSFVRLSNVTGEMSQGGTPLAVGFDALCWHKPV